MKTTVDNDKSTMTTMMTVSMTITASELSPMIQGFKDYGDNRYDNECDDDGNDGDDNDDIGDN